MSTKNQRTRSDDDAASQTSTLRYAQEPYEEYKGRVRALLRELYDDDVADRAEIQRMAGGSGNRVVGVTLALAESSPVQLVLRTPRFDICGDVEDAEPSAILDAVRSFVTVPDVIRFDNSADNALERSFLLMSRLPGISLQDAMLEMTIDAKCQIAIEIAQLIHKILRVPVPARIGPLLGSENGELCVGLYEDGREPPPDNFRGFVFARLEELSEAAVLCWPDDPVRPELCARLKAAADVVLPESSCIFRNVLGHPDLAARNIMVERSDEGRWHVTGVLDWDDTAVVPYEIACMCPGWLWSSEGESVRHQHEYYYDPDHSITDKNSLRIKNAFVDEIEGLEPGFLDVVRRTRDRELRRLYHLARDGFAHNDDLDDVDRIEAAAATCNVSTE